jgi:hypothetical protein
VRVDGEIVRGCLVLAASLDGAEVTTIEGLTDSGEVADLQDAFVARNAAQCGYCTPGMVMAAADILRHHPDAAREEIRSTSPATTAAARATRRSSRPSRRRCARGGDGTMNEMPRPGALSREDLPNSYIGRSVPRPNVPKLVQGRATYTDDVVLPRMLHAGFLRSPHAHARIVSVDAAPALAVQGVVRVFTGADLATLCDPGWQRWTTSKA